MEICEIKFQICMSIIFDLSLSFFLTDQISRENKF